jgi:hypothetical protein
LCDCCRAWITSCKAIFLAFFVSIVDEAIGGNAARSPCAHSVLS